MSHVLLCKIQVLHCQIVCLRYSWITRTLLYISSSLLCKLIETNTKTSKVCIFLFLNSINSHFPPSKWVTIKKILLMKGFVPWIEPNKASFHVYVLHDRCNIDICKFETERKEEFVMWIEPNNASFLSASDLKNSFLSSTLFHKTFPFKFHFYLAAFIKRRFGFFIYFYLVFIICREIFIFIYLESNYPRHFPSRWCPNK